MASTAAPRILAVATNPALDRVARLGGPAAGIVTEGLVYPLRGEVLEPGSSRGISNVFTGSEERVSLESTR